MCLFTVISAALLWSAPAAPPGSTALSDAAAAPEIGYAEPGGLEEASFQIPDKGCTLYIDLDNCVMLVYLDGKPFKAYPVSGGSNQTPSPVGTWHVVKISSWGEGFGGSWLGLDVPWGIYGIHGTVAPWFLGEYNVSHGCIRMRDEDVQAVRKLVSYGSIVHIKQELPFRAMENGMIGSDVQKTQKMLKKRGYYHAQANGIFGSAMERAVRRFQRDNKLREDGIVGRRTYEKISGKSAE